MCSTWLSSNRGSRSGSLPWFRHIFLTSAELPSVHQVVALSISRQTFEKRRKNSPQKRKLKKFHIFTNKCTTCIFKKFLTTFFQSVLTFLTFFPNQQNFTL